MIKGLVLGLRVTGIYKLLTDMHDPDRYLDRIDKLLLKHKKINQFKINLLLYKTVGLIYKGDFDDSCIILKSIDDSKLKGTYTEVYYNDLLYCLLLLGNIKEAKELYTVNSYIYNKALTSKKIGNSVKDTIATYEFLLSNIELSERLFNEIIDSEIKGINLAPKYYFLGLINKSKGDTTKAIEYLEKVGTFAPNSYFQKMAVEHIKHYKEDVI